MSVNCAVPRNPVSRPLRAIQTRLQYRVIRDAISVAVEPVKSVPQSPNGIPAKPSILPRQY